MESLEIKDYLARVGIRRITELDTALAEAYGELEGGRHIENLTALFDRSEERLLKGGGDSMYLRRQEELVDYWNQSLKMSILASSFYDRVFFRRAMEYLVRYDRFFEGAEEIFDIGCGNGILTCFLALVHPASHVTGMELSDNAVLVAKELAGKLQAGNVDFIRQPGPGDRRCDVLLSCRTAHENAVWKPLMEEAEPAALTVEELAKRHGDYAEKLCRLVKPGGYLVSVERYKNDNAYAGLTGALENAGFRREKGTHVEFSCKNGDETAVFQGMVFRLQFTG